MALFCDWCLYHSFVVQVCVVGTSVVKHSLWAVFCGLRMRWTICRPFLEQESGLEKQSNWGNFSCSIRKWTIQRCNFATTSTVVRSLCSLLLLLSYLSCKKGLTACICRIIDCRIKTALVISQITAIVPPVSLAHN